MASILVTGAAGFLGRHFFDELKKNKSDDVIGVDNFSSEYAKYPLSMNEDEFYVEDIRTFFVNTNAEDFDYVYHFAAPVGGRVKIEGDPLYNAESLSIDSELFRWVSASKEPPMVIYPSSSAVYPISLQSVAKRRLPEDDFRITEDTWGRPDEMYGFTKMAGEFLAHNAAKYGVDTLVLRPFSGYGEDQPLEYPMSSIVQRAVRREDPLIVWGPGTQTRDFIHVDDIVRLTLMLVKAQTSLSDHEGPGVFGYTPINLATGTATNFLEVARMAAELVGYKPDIATLPDKPFGVMHRVGSMSKLQGWTIDQPKIRVRSGIERMVRHLEQEAAA